MGCFSDVLRSAFTKCKASELEHLLKQWGYLTEDELLQLNFSKSKMCVFRDVLSLCQVCFYKLDCRYMLPISHLEPILQFM